MIRALALCTTIASCACIPPIEEARLCAAEAAGLAAIVAVVALANDDSSSPSYLRITDPPATGPFSPQ